MVKLIIFNALVSKAFVLFNRLNSKTAKIGWLEIIDRLNAINYLE